ncbi:hypothetical protein ON010_g9092 [Phytophthora cinnamomi]|nr:hypothetical protein ON010_g9092 [Phytophthora cinnamomi]
MAPVAGVTATVVTYPLDLVPDGWARSHDLPDRTVHGFELWYLLDAERNGGRVPQQARGGGYGRVDVAVESSLVRRERCRCWTGVETGGVSVGYSQETHADAPRAALPNVWCDPGVFLQLGVLLRRAAARRHTESIYPERYDAMSLGGQQLSGS